MAKVLQWIFRIISGSLILSLSVMLVVYYIFLRSIPEYNKTVELPGLISPIEIVRDTSNVPHIYGDNVLTYILVLAMLMLKIGSGN